MPSFLAFLTTFPTTFEATWTAAAHAESRLGLVCRLALCILAPALRGTVNCLHSTHVGAVILAVMAIEPFLATTLRNAEAPDRSCIAGQRSRQVAPEYEVGGGRRRASVL